MCELYFSQQDLSQERQVHDTWYTSPPLPCSWQTPLINHSILSWFPNGTTKSFLNLAPYRISYYLDIHAYVAKLFCHSWSKWIKQKDAQEKKPFSFSFLHDKLQLKKKRSFENPQNSIYSFRDKTGGNLSAPFHFMMQERWVLKNQAMAVLLLETKA